MEQLQKVYRSFFCVLAVSIAGIGNVSAAGKAEPAPPLTAPGKLLEAHYADLLAGLRAEITNALPVVAEAKKAALLKVCEAAKAAQSEAATASAAANQTKEIKGKIDYWQKYWIGDADKKITQAQADLKIATTDAAREAAQNEIAKWQTNKIEGEKEIKKAQADLEKAKVNEPALAAANQSAQAALVRARTDELNAAKDILADVEPCLSSDTLDPKLVKAAVLAGATPRGLAAFAQRGQAQQALIEKLVADEPLMKVMLIAGGAKFGEYGRAMEIYTALQHASPQAGEGVLQRLALATSLEHAVPIQQHNAADKTNAPAFVDPVQRYRHYEQAYLNGELDPAFKNFSAWEYRMVVNCDAPDQILAWGREMLRTYRPDHVANPNYGWRYSMAVRTEVRYGSQNIENDLPSLNEYQNIPKDGGVCGRRAFFGRFILRAFGIPTWGVTQHAHAALSHWTPNGWVINLGAGFDHSWWDKDEVPRSGLDFLLETQAREHTQDYLKVLRAQWVSRVLGEPTYNDRKQTVGGFWSNLAHYEAVVLATHAVKLGPLGAELAEANEPSAKQSTEAAPAQPSDQQIVTGRNGDITIPAVAHGKATGPSVAMKSFSVGMQMNCSGGFKTEYVFAAPQAGQYALTARVATLQEGQKFVLAVNNARQPVAIAVPYTVGLWQLTRPVEVSLTQGQNVFHFAVQDGSRAVTIKDFILTPAP